LLQRLFSSFEYFTAVSIRAPLFGGIMAPKGPKGDKARAKTKQGPKQPKQKPAPPKQYKKTEKAFKITPNSQ
jgi:hypothetical protein